MMPSLFQAESGRLDFAEIRVTPLNPEQIEALKKADAERAAKKAEMDAKVAAKRREQAAALLAREGTLLSNGNFETESKKKDAPEGWGKGGGISWEKDESDGNRFIRLTSLTPGKTVLLYRECPVPEGAAALEMTWKQRITGLKKGPKPGLMRASCWSSKVLTARRCRASPPRRILKKTQMAGWRSGPSSWCPQRQCP
ncbi:hypothetical protein [Verrucomicrobium spinosum]|uniref:hypothetical protein n=1 Tax=Verrucomicrobium spinosum TaxID=2736 RepID=UPI0009462E3B|nr:hypothetical protein [Verrucomicrobium spinosum]